MKKRSDLRPGGAERAPHPSLLRVGGFTERGLQNPIIGIANSFNEIISGHTHLDKRSEAVKAGMGLDRDVALITDGRFSGVSRGAAIGHVSPEAASGGSHCRCSRR